MKIIQTNRTMIDFQSYIYDIKDQTWNSFKNYILNEDYYKNKALNDLNNIYKFRPKDSFVEKVNINDNFHLEVIFNNSRSCSYMKLND